MIMRTWRGAVRLEDEERRVRDAHADHDEVAEADLDVAALRPPG